MVARSATTLEFVKSVASEVIGDLEVDEPLTTATWLNVRKIPLPKEFAPGGRAPNGKLSEPTPSVAGAMILSGRAIFDAYVSDFLN